MLIITDPQISNAVPATDLLTALAALVAAAVAVYGVWQWKYQLKGKTHYETARRYLKASLRVRDAIKFVRNPFIPVAEMESALKENGIDSKEYNDHAQTNRAVYSVRWKKVIEAWTDLEAEILEAEVSWGRSAVTIQEPLDALVRKLRAAISLYLQGLGKAEHDDLIYDIGEEDKFSKEISAAIESIKKYLKPYLD